jgi:hypothetical protein
MRTPEYVKGGDHAEVAHADSPVRLDKKVARMWVGVKEPVLEGHLEDDPPLLRVHRFSRKLQSPRPGGSRAHCPAAWKRRTLLAIAFYRCLGAFHVAL